jgi:hypothetical protein
VYRLYNCIDTPRCIAVYRYKGRGTGRVRCIAVYIQFFDVLTAVSWVGCIAF